MSECIKKRDIEKIRVNKKGISIVCFLFFMLWEAIMTIHYEDWYFYDETYHISSSNAEFYASSNYQHFPYVNITIRYLSEIFGKSYYTYKLLPFIASTISIGALLYVLVHIAKKIYSIVIFTVMICLHTVIICNHLYIRGYVWEEMVFSVLCLLLYLISTATSKCQKIFLYCCYFCLPLFFLLMDLKDSSMLGITVFGILALLLNDILKKIIPKIKKVGKVKLFIFCIFLGFVFIETVIVLSKIGLIKLPVDINSYSKPYNYPIFIRNFYCGGIGLVVGGIGYGYYLITKIDNYYDNNIIGIYCMGMLPLLGIGMVFYDGFPMRVFAAYLPTLILITVLWFDTLVGKKIYQILAGFLMLYAIIRSQPDIDIKAFLKIPYMQGETQLENYSDLIKQAKTEIANGKKCICMWTNDHHAAAFNDIDAEYVIAFEDSTNMPKGYSKEDLQDILNLLKETRDSYIVLIGPHCTWRTEAVYNGFVEIMFKNYPYKIYQKEAYLFYIN